MSQMFFCFGTHKQRLLEIPLHHGLRRVDSEMGNDVWGLKMCQLPIGPEAPTPDFDGMNLLPVEDWLPGAEPKSMTPLVCSAFGSDEFATLGQLVYHCRTSHGSSDDLETRHPDQDKMDDDYWESALERSKQVACTWDEIRSIWSVDRYVARLSLEITFS
ncbi:hypothetical protein CDD80_3367 [Ophiocordyceps camponoti-rufipedis]|uniref:Uncharacterized protein n=1 Tax=Ophiocordyceps camponoti-rufipedis TaxID=2004952 RepID=A0A2C5ZGK6_9HYPO|nr:hypothetical protein CDD80_3367 [Ophiocordyceps camponoti-rufipedis]